jgi:hypothetical protein
MTSSPRDCSVSSSSCPSKHPVEASVQRALGCGILQNEKPFADICMEEPMEARWIADRAALRCLARPHPDWTHEELALCIGRSRSFVKKWLKRFREAPPDDLTVLHSRSCAHKTPPPTVHPRIIERIVEMRERPPEHLQRVPGPKALLYYLPRDAELQALGAALPRSTRTIWKILRQEGCILDEPTRRRKPLELQEPLEEVHMDFKDASTVPANPEGKQQHVVEVLNG